MRDDPELPFSCRAGYAPLPPPLPQPEPPDDGDESGRTRLSRVNPSSSAPVALSVLFTATNDVEAFFFGRLWEEGATRALFDTWVATLDEERKANKGDGP